MKIYELINENGKVVAQSASFDWIIGEAMIFHSKWNFEVHLISYKID